MRRRVYLALSLSVALAFGFGLRHFEKRAGAQSQTNFPIQAASGGGGGGDVPTTPQPNGCILEGNGNPAPNGYTCGPVCTTHQVVHGGPPYACGLVDASTELFVTAGVSLTTPDSASTLAGGAWVLTAGKGGDGSGATIAGAGGLWQSIAGAGGDGGTTGGGGAGGNNLGIGGKGGLAGSVSGAGGNGGTVGWNARPGGAASTGTGCGGVGGLLINTGGNGGAATSTGCGGAGAVARMNGGVGGAGSSAQLPGVGGEVRNQGGTGGVNNGGGSAVGGNANLWGGSAGQGSGATVQGGVGGMASVTGGYGANARTGAAAMNGGNCNVMAGGAGDNNQGGGTAHGGNTLIDGGSRGANGGAIANAGEIHIGLSEANNGGDTNLIDPIGETSLVRIGATGAKPAPVQIEGAASFSSTISAGSHQINNVADPTSAQDAATAAYVAAQIATISTIKVRATTTAPLSGAYTYLNGVSGVGATIAFTSLGACQTFDGITVALGNRLLIKDEATTNRPYNGVYSVTTLGSGGAACVLTRTMDADTPAELADILVSSVEGTNAGKAYDLQLAAGSIVIGTTNLIPWTQISGGGLTVSCAQLPALTIGASAGVTSPSGSCVTSISVGSQAQGDTLYFDGTNWVRLPKCADGQLVRYNSTIPVCSELYATTATSSSGTTGAGTVNTTVFNVPPAIGATSSTSSFALVIRARLSQAMIGAGSISFTCGTASAGGQYIAAQTIDATTTVGTLWGTGSASAGSACTAANLYDCIADASTAVVCTTVLTGVATTQAIINLTLTGQQE